MSAYPFNGQLGKHLSELRARSQRRKLLRESVMFVCGLILIVLVMLATGCASLPPPPCEPAKTLPMPAVQSSPPTIPWSQQAQDYFEKSRELLTSATVTSN